MKEVIQIFEEISKIPHCSHDTDKLFDYICKFCQNTGYKIKTDSAKNIYAYSKKPKLCFQSHYDMVCVGEASHKKGLKLYTQEGFLKAKDSSLGADNGIGVATQLYLMQKYTDLEFLFTSNEEVGLLGAKDLEVCISSDYLINLDSECFGEIVLGCAGGYDGEVTFRLEKLQKEYKNTYKITSRGFKGGHSGIDIHKNIPNAIISTMKFLENIEYGIFSINGGEKTNSIPVFIEAIISTDENLKSNENFLIEEFKEKVMFYKSKCIRDFILNLKSGVREMQDNEVIDSLNISLIHTQNEEIKISLMGRANIKTLLEKNSQEVYNLAKKISSEAKITLSDFYPPWQRSLSDDDEFLNIVKKAFKNNSIKICQIHAGLECGILAERFEKMGKGNVKMLSIGPTILNPHSINEKLDLNSFEAFLEVLEYLLQNYTISS